MKASELIFMLRREIETSGDVEVDILANLGKDKEGVNRNHYSDKIMVTTSYINNEGSDKIRSDVKISILC